MTADPKPQRATTREHLIERLQEFHRDACKPADGSRDTVSGYWVRTELEKLLDLASRLPSPPAAAESSEAIANAVQKAVEECARCLPNTWGEMNRYLMPITPWDAKTIDRFIGDVRARIRRVAQSAPAELLRYEGPFYASANGTNDPAPAEPAAGEGVVRGMKVDRWWQAAGWHLRPSTPTYREMIERLAGELWCRGLSLDEIVRVATGGGE